ncbi:MULTISPECIES: stalk domain-containing protein [Caldisericum]
MKKKCMIFILVLTLLIGFFVAKEDTKGGKYDFIGVNSGLPSINHSAIAISPVNPNLIYIGTKIGLYASDDGGESFWQRTIDPSQEEVWVKAVCPSPIEEKTVFIGTYGKGLLVSKDGGFSWESMNTGLTSQDIETIAIDPKNTKIMYVGTYGSGIFKSTNGGKSFSLKSKDLPTLRIKKIVLSPQDTNIVYVVLYDNAGIFRSDDGGNNWIEINNGISGSDKDISSFAIDSINDGTIYAGTHTYGKLLKSNDYGETWKQVNNKFTESFISDIVVDFKNSNLIYVATGEGLFKSENGGVVFKKSSNGLPNSYLTHLLINPKDQNVLFTSTFDAGLYKSTDAGKNWISKNEGLPYYSIEMLKFNPKDSSLILATDNGLYLSKDRQVFSRVGPEGVFFTCISFDPSDSNYVYAGTYYKGLYKSDDGGNTWRKLSTAFDNFDLWDIEVDPKDYKIIYVATYNNGVYKSTDMGNSFKQINSGLKSKDVYALAIDPTNTQTIYAATALGAFKSTNGGATWSEINKGILNLFLYDIEVNPKDPKIVYAASNGSGVYKSADSGTSWVELSRGLENKKVYDITLNPGYPNVLTAGTEGGVFFLENYSNTWEKMNDGLTDLTVYSVAFDPNNISFLYVGTCQGGLFRKQVTRTIKVLPTEGGKVEPSGTLEVVFGSEVVFNITPDSGYKLKEIYAGSNKYQNPSTTFRVTLGTTYNSTFRAVFEKIAPSNIVILLQIGNRIFTVNGDRRTLDSPPIIKNNRTLLPIRAVVESLGGTVGWDGAEHKVTVALGSKTLELWIGKPIAKVNGRDTLIDATNPNVVPEIVNSRTMLPLRFVAESLGADVQWDGTTKTITITYIP